MRRKSIRIQLHTIGIPTHTFGKDEFIEIVSRHALPMSTANKMANVLKSDLEDDTAHWLRECFKHQIVKWRLHLQDKDDKSFKLPLPKDSDEYEKVLDKGVLLLFASLVSQMRLGTEKQITLEWGVFNIGPDGVCQEVLQTEDDKRELADIKATLSGIQSSAVKDEQKAEG